MAQLLCRADGSSRLPESFKDIAFFRIKKFVAG